MPFLRIRSFDAPLVRVGCTSFQSNSSDSSSTAPLRRSYTAEPPPFRYISTGALRMRSLGNHIVRLGWFLPFSWGRFAFPSWSICRLDSSLFSRRKDVSVSDERLARVGRVGVRPGFGRWMRRKQSTSDGAMAVVGIVHWIGTELSIGRNRRCRHVRRGASRVGTNTWRNLCRQIHRQTSERIGHAQSAEVSGESAA